MHASRLLPALLLVATPALAQDGPDEQQVRTFFQTLDERSVAAADSGDWSGLVEWVNEHVEPDANLAIKGSMVGTNGPAMSFDMVLSGDDLQRYAAMAAGMMRGGSGDTRMLSDYDLNATVEAVTQLPDGSANAVVRFVETGILAMPPAGGGESGSQPESMTIAAMSVCSFRLTDDAGTIRITLAACQSDTTF